MVRYRTFQLRCSALSDFAALGQGIGALQSLRHLDLNFDGTEFNDVASLGQGIGALQSVQHLQLNFRNCSALNSSRSEALSDVEALGQGTELKGSIGEGPNKTNYSDQSSVRILAKKKIASI